MRQTNPQFKSHVKKIQNICCFWFRNIVFCMNADKKNTAKLYVLHQLFCAPVLYVDFANIPLGFCLWNQQLSHLEFVKFVIFCYRGNDWYASNKDIFIGAISLYSGVAWSQGWSLPSIGVVIMLNCCLSNYIYTQTIILHGWHSDVTIVTI